MLQEVIVSGLLQGCTYVLLSLGLTLMFGVLKVVNFAHGDFLMIGMYCAYFLFAAGHVDPLVSVLIVVPLFIVLGSALYRVVIDRTRHAHDPALAQVFATAGLSIILQNLAQLFVGKDYLSVHTAWASFVLTVGPVRMEGSKLVSALTALLLAAGLQFFLYRSRLGKQMRAVAQNPTSAGLIGINVDRVFMWTFGIACGAVGLAGVLLANSYTVYPTVGLQFVLLAFMTVVIGGLGSIPGAVAGGLLVGLVEATAGYLFGAIIGQVCIYVLFLAVLLYRPSGLLGIAGYEEGLAE